MATKKATKVVDGSQDVPVVEKSAKQRYRVLRPIQHGKILLGPSDLVDMAPEDAQHLVETAALAPHVIAEQVSRVVDLPGSPKPALVGELDGATISSTRDELTAVEVASGAEPNN